MFLRLLLLACVVVAVAGQIPPPGSWEEEICHNDYYGNYVCVESLQECLAAFNSLEFCAYLVAQAAQAPPSEPQSLPEPMSNEMSAPAGRK